MTVLVLENLTAWPGLINSARLFGGRLLRTIDELVRARAARAVPEWKMREVRAQVSRCRKTGR